MNNKQDCMCIRGTVDCKNHPQSSGLTSKQIEAGWHQTFSTGNPYCPCNLKSFTKAVEWAERALATTKEPKP